MARRKSKVRRKQVRGICKDRVYTVKIAARLVGVSEPTFRKWGREGLRLITDKRPHMVRGADLIEHMHRRQAARLQPMADGQLFCMRCKAPREAAPTGLYYKPYTDVTGRLNGFCADCGAKIGRFCSLAELDILSKQRVVTIKDGM